MRRYIAILALLLVGCSEPEPQTIINEIVKDPTYTDALSIVGISRSDFGGQGGTAQIIVKSNVDYNITSDQQWLTVVEGSRATDLAHNKAVTISVGEYAIDYKGVKRSGTITFASTDGNHTCAVTISQSPKDNFHIELASITPQTVPSLGGEVVITLDANVEYNVSLESVDWLSMTENQGKGTIKLTSLKNIGTADRSAIITFTAQNLEPLEITIKQLCILSETDKNTIVIPLPDSNR